MSPPNTSNGHSDAGGFDPKVLDEQEATCRAIRENIQVVSRLEDKFRSNRTFAEKTADSIGSFSGSMSFVFLHLGVFLGWIVINLGAVPVIKPFDPYPFMLLNMAVSLEAIFLSTFVMMKQNRMSKRADSRAHLDLQINLLAEQEMTMVLQMLRLIGTKVGVSAPHLDRELAQMSEETPIEVLATAIEANLPNQD